MEKVVIIGNNGAGKTGFGYALMDIVTTVIGFTKDIGQNSEACFINGFGDSNVATFHYEFSHHGSVIVYEYSKSSPSRIVKERLTIDRDVIFDYDIKNLEEMVFNHDLVNMDYIVPDGTESVMRILRHNSRLHQDSLIRTVIRFAENSLYYRAMWRMDDHIGQIDYDVNVSAYIIESNLVDCFESFLKEQCGINLKIVANGRDLAVVTDKGLKPFFEVASRGTAIMCRLFAWITRSKGRDALIYFDDFDDLFDYKTAENVMNYVIKGTKAQCIFVTHNIGLISTENLRPDCCFIMKDNVLRSLASLTNKNIRRGHNLAKMIRDGEFTSEE